MEKLFSIGQVSKIKGVTIKALRYYHKEEILVPKHIDEKTGYRYYSLNQFIHIDIIKGARELGTSIEDIKELFKNNDTSQLLEFLKRKKLEAQENINKMREIIKSIDDISDYIKYSENAYSRNEIKLETFENRYIVALPCKGIGDLKELIYYSELDKYIQDQGLETNMKRGIIYNLNLDGIREPLYVFSILKENLNTDIDKNIKILPRGKYLTATYNKENENGRINEVLKYIKDNNIKVKNYIEMDLVSDLFDIENYDCQIQMLIHK